jgi:hypothetical protein
VFNKSPITKHKSPITIHQSLTERITNHSFSTPMVMTPLSGVFLALACIAAIAGVGSVFELSSGEPELGIPLTRIILGFSLPVTIGAFVAAVRSAKAE